MSKISLSQFIDELAKLSRARRRNAIDPLGSNETTEDGRVVGCTYVIRDQDGVPIDDKHRHCVVGQTLANLGVLVPEGQEGLDAHAVITECSAVRGRFRANDVSQVAMAALAVQRSADQGETWGSSIRKATTQVDKDHDTCVAVRSGRWTKLLTAALKDPA